MRDSRRFLGKIRVYGLQYIFRAREHASCLTSINSSLYSKMKTIIIFILLLTTTTAYAESITVKQISGKDCTDGVHEQPNGPFAIYTFCDDALGTNISIFLKNLGAPLQGPYTLTKRFWQSDKWGADVTSFAWLPDRKSLIVATSAIYGSGNIFKLNLETQHASILYDPKENICLTRLDRIAHDFITIIITDCDLKEKQIKIKYNQLLDLNEDRG